jgi:hypothetical protein
MALVLFVKAGLFGCIHDKLLFAEMRPGIGRLEQEFTLKMRLRMIVILFFSAALAA